MPRALIIDDSRATRARVSQLLEQAGWEVSSEESAELGAAAALSSPPDIVISDLWMPGLSGLLLCRLLHEDSTTAHVPIVLMSARLDRRSQFWAKHSGAALTLDKARMEDLPNILSGLLDTRRAAAPPPATEVTPASIPSRLSGLLDHALFESVIAGELTRLAINPEVGPFLDGLVELLGQVLTYRWLALSAEGGGVQVSFAHVHPSDQEQSLAEIAETLHPMGDDNGTVVCDVRAQKAADVPGTNDELDRFIWNLDVGTSTTGRFAVCVDRRECTPPERHVFEVVRRELAAPVRALLLSERAQQLARTDMLTTLWNRRQGLEFLEQSYSAYKRYGHVLSLAMLDIDHFKKVNDTFGHHCGDQAIQHVADILRATCRKADAVARWGGEEFLLILPSTGSAGARIAAERVRQRLAASPLTFDSGEEHRVTISAGVAQCGEDGYEAALSRADQALYLAKERGRNRVELG